MYIFEEIELFVHLKIDRNEKLYCYCNTCTI